MTPPGSLAGVNGSIPVVHVVLMIRGTSLNPTS